MLTATVLDDAERGIRGVLATSVAVLLVASLLGTSVTHACDLGALSENSSVLVSVAVGEARLLANCDVPANVNVTLQCGANSTVTFDRWRQAAGGELVVIPPSGSSVLRGVSVEMIGASVVETTVHHALSFLAEFVINCRLTLGPGVNISSNATAASFIAESSVESSVIRADGAVIHVLNAKGANDESSKIGIAAALSFVASQKREQILTVRDSAILVKACIVDVAATEAAIPLRDGTRGTAVFAVVRANSASRAIITVQNLTIVVRDCTVSALGDSNGANAIAGIACASVFSAFTIQVNDSVLYVQNSTLTLRMSLTLPPYQWTVASAVLGVASGGNLNPSFLRMERTAFDAVDCVIVVDSLSSGAQAAVGIASGVTGTTATTWDVTNVSLSVRSSTITVQGNTATAAVGFAPNAESASAMSFRGVSATSVDSNVTASSVVSRSVVAAVGIALGLFMGGTIDVTGIRLAATNSAIRVSFNGPSRPALAGVGIAAIRFALGGRIAVTISDALITGDNVAIDLRVSNWEPACAALGIALYGTDRSASLDLTQIAIKANAATVLIYAQIAAGIEGGALAVVGAAVSSERGVDSSIVVRDFQAIAADSNLTARIDGTRFGHMALVGIMSAGVTNTSGDLIFVICVATCTAAGGANATVAGMSATMFNGTDPTSLALVVVDSSIRARTTGRSAACARVGAETQDLPLTVAARFSGAQFDCDTVGWGVAVTQPNTGWRPRANVWNTTVNGADAAAVSNFDGAEFGRRQLSPAVEAYVPAVCHAMTPTWTQSTTVSSVQSATSEGTVTRTNKQARRVATGTVQRDTHAAARRSATTTRQREVTPAPTTGPPPTRISTTAAKQRSESLTQPTVRRNSTAGHDDVVIAMAIVPSKEVTGQEIGAVVAAALTSAVFATAATRPARLSAVIQLSGCLHKASDGDDYDMPSVVALPMQVAPPSAGEVGQRAAVASAVTAVVLVLMPMGVALAAHWRRVSAEHVSTSLPPKATDKPLDTTNSGELAAHLSLQPWRVLRWRTSVRISRKKLSRLRHRTWPGGSYKSLPCWLVWRSSRCCSRSAAVLRWLCWHPRWRMLASGTRCSFPCAQRLATTPRGTYATTTSSMSAAP
jgi:hypothetical protein